MSMSMSMSMSNHPDAERVFRTDANDQIKPSETFIHSDFDNKHWLR